MESPPTDHQIRRWVADFLGVAQVRRAADLCEKKSCQSYLYCLMIPGKGHRPLTPPVPTCARRALEICDPPAPDARPTPPADFAGEVFDRLVKVAKWRNHYGVTSDHPCRCRSCEFVRWFADRMAGLGREIEEYT